MHCTEFAQKPARHSDKRVTFPATVTHYEQRAKIYRPGANFPFYRVAFKVAGQRRMMTFASYSEAKAAAEAKVKELHNGQQAAGLTAKEGHAALTIREALAHHHRDTGRKVSAVEAVTTYLAAIKLLPPGSTLLEAVRSFRENIAAVARKPLAEAVAECNADREAKTVSENGKRPQLNPVYVADTARVLRGFSTTNTALAVCDVTKDHLDLFLKTRHELSVKSRNHFRATLMMFFRWCQRPDFLSATTRLLDADGLHREEAEVGGGDGVSIFHPAVGLHPGGVGEHDVIAVILEAVPQPIPVEGGCDGDRGNTVPVGIKQLQDRRQVAGGFLVDEPRSAFVPEAAEGVVAVQVNSDPNLHCGSPVVEGLGLSLFSHLRLLTRLPDNAVTHEQLVNPVARPFGVAGGAKLLRPGNVPPPAKLRRRVGVILQAVAVRDFVDVHAARGRAFDAPFHLRGIHD